mmetsp:Transcript_75415/g.233995  ORF Transcript_75415/g.233995 Transcript_75415/m.233995 type:complete len:288 (+) Transcript_75415:795-1658(+)
MVSLYSLFSAFRFVVASPTSASRSSMPFSRAVISSVSVSTMALASFVAFSRSEMPSSRDFNSSSVLSSWDSQYAFLSSSVFCSLSNNVSILSIIARTFSKFTFRPRNATSIRSTRGSCDATPLRCAAFNTSRASPRSCLYVTAVCKNELGNVFLNRSSESSLFRILMVSASATSSSARAFCTADHSFFFFSHVFARFARNCWSFARDSVVSSRSSFNVSISTPSSPTRSVFDSMAFWLVAISFSFALTNAAVDLMAFSSSAVASSSVVCMVSFICFSMPVMEPLWGA